MNDKKDLKYLFIVAIYFSIENLEFDNFIDEFGNEKVNFNIPEDI